MDSTLASGSAARTYPVSAPARQVAVTASLLALACVLGLVESSLPGLPLVPWLRFGIANVAVVAALMLGGARMAVAVGLGRVALVALATGSLFTPTFYLATAGAVASLAVMVAARSLGAGLSPVGWSAAGSAAHVTGQFAAAAVLLDVGGILVLAPPSVLISLVLGAIVGSLALVVVSRIPKG